MSLRHLSHFLPRNIAIFICHILDRLSLSAQQVSLELTSDKPVESPGHVVWLLMVLLVQGCVISMCFGGYESVHVLKGKRSSSHSPLIYPEREWLLPRGVLELKAWGLCLLWKPVTSSHPAGGDISAEKLNTEFLAKRSWSFISTVLLVQSHHTKFHSS